MTDPVNIISKCAGLNTLLDPFQPINSQASDGQNQKALTKAKNVRITDSHKIERGYTTSRIFNLTAGHSLFCDDSDCLVHDHGSMYRVETSLTLSAALRTGMSGEYVDHTKVGQAIYFGNRLERGVYSGGICSEWKLDKYNGPETNKQWAVTPPIFDHLASFVGMILFSYDNILFATEPGKPGLWEAKPVWVTDTKITMIKPVITDGNPPTGGVFVSDKNRISYLGGFLDDETRTFSEPRTTNYPAIEWSVAHGYVDGSIFGQKSGLCAVFTTEKGICLGYPDGELVNITQRNIKMPTGLTIGASLMHNYNIITTVR